MNWLLIFHLTSTFVTWEGSRPVGSPEECIEQAYERLREYDEAQDGPVIQFTVRCEPMGHR